MAQHHSPSIHTNIMKACNCPADRTADVAQWMMSPDGQMLSFSNCTQRQFNKSARDAWAFLQMDL